MNTTYLRVAAAVMILGVIVWLYVAGPPKDETIKKLNRALTSHSVGRINDVKRNALESTIREMVQALELPIEVAVDRPYQTNRLNIYTTSAAAANTTRCGPGNARYDPALDSIFIDEQFFDGKGYRQIYEASAYGSVVGFNEDLTFPDIFVRFILLHELGHRQLHRRVSGYLPHISEDSSEQLRNREREADRFAVAGMKKFYAFDKEHKGGLVGPPLREAVGLSEAFDHDIDPSEQVYVDLVGTLFLMANATLYLRTPYSPFFESDSHPTFLDRAQGAIEAVLENQSLEPKLKANFLFLRASLRREATVARLSFTEVISPAPVNDVSFGPDEVLIASIGNSQLFRVRNSELQRRAQPGAHTLVYAEPRGTANQPSGPEPNKGFWSRPNASIALIDAEGDVWNYVDGRRVPASLPLPASLTTHDCFHLLTPPQPTDKAIALACDKGFIHWVISVGNAEKITARKQTDILRELTGRLGRPVGDAQPLAFDDDGLYLALTGLGTEKERLIGIARLSPSSLVIDKAILFRGDDILGKDNASDQVWPLLTSRAAGHQRQFILSSKNVQEPSMAAWELFPQATPRMVARQSLLVSEVPPQVTPDLIADFDPYVAKTWWLTPTKSLIYLANDSLYLFDENAMRFEVVFHPTFEGIDVRLGQGSRWAVFMRGGSRVFLFDSSAGE
jgi:hypothetical protein